MGVPGVVQKVVVSGYTENRQSRPSRGDSALHVLPCFEPGRQNFIRPEPIAAASARIVSAHATLPLVKIWGAGDVASADGMRFTAPSSAI
ncbi:MAG: hypothetical protein QOF70_531, partial [Acetobacteraceae bacterium]|nr:hypothetical protein [Acetobacteraceae bacterium]